MSLISGLRMKKNGQKKTERASSFGYLDAVLVYSFDVCFQPSKNLETVRFQYYQNCLCCL